MSTIHPEKNLKGQNGERGDETRHAAAPAEGDKGILPAWSMSCDQLSLFWGTAYPRIVGYLWQEGLTLQAGDDMRPLVTEQLGRMNYEIRFPEAMQIRCLGEGSHYDFILSNLGIDLPIPSRPKTDPGGLQDIFMKYMYRKAPTHPLQIPGMRSPKNFRTPVTSPAVFNPSYSDKFMKPSWWQEGQGPVTFEQMIEALIETESTRTWQMKGSNFGHIMGELPRIVANMWYDKGLWDQRGRRNGSDSTTLSEETPPSFSILKGGKAGRKMLEDRIEIGLPEALDLVFKAGVPHNGDAGPQASAECEVNEHGLVLVIPPAPESVDQFFSAWASGEAANVMFSFTPTEP